MARLNLLLLALVLASALGTVYAQHASRRLFAELEREQAAQQRLEIEFRQLQLEQSTWATHGRVERVAREELRMVIPQASDLRIVQP